MRTSFTIEHLEKKLKEGSIRGYSVEIVEEKKKSKYGNKWVLVDGIKFQSKREANRYYELKVLQMTGEIKDLELQVPFELNEGGGHSLVYKADFVYYRAGERIIEDSKGYKTKTYLKKKRLMMEVHGIEIKEV